MTEDIRCIFRSMLLNDRLRSIVNLEACTSITFVWYDIHSKQGIERTREHLK